MDKTSEHWNILSQINDWIKYSDNKATIFLTIYSVIITLVYTNAIKVSKSLENSTPVLVLTILATISLLISAFYFFNCINPNLKNDNPKSVIYFGHIGEKFKTHSDYNEQLSAILKSTDSLQQELSEQIHVNSKIAWKKFSDVTVGIRWFAVTCVLLIITVIVYLTT